MLFETEHDSKPPVRHLFVIILLESGAQLQARPTLLSAFFMGALPTSLPVRANSAWQLCPRCVLSHLNKKKHQSRLVGEQSERERRKLAKMRANSFSTPPRRALFPCN